MSLRDCLPYVVVLRRGAMPVANAIALDCNGNLRLPNCSGQLQGCKRVWLIGLVGLMMTRQRLKEEKKVTVLLVRLLADCLSSHNEVKDAVSEVSEGKEEWSDGSKRLRRK